MQTYAMCLISVFIVTLYVHSSCILFSWISFCEWTWSMHSIAFHLFTSCFNWSSGSRASPVTAVHLDTWQLDMWQLDKWQLVVLGRRSLYHNSVRPCRGNCNAYYTIIIWALYRYAILQLRPWGIFIDCRAYYTIIIVVSCLYWYIIL